MNTEMIAADTALVITLLTAIIMYATGVYVGLHKDKFFNE